MQAEKCLHMAEAEGVRRSPTKFELCLPRKRATPQHSQSKLCLCFRLAPFLSRRSHCPVQAKHRPGLVRGRLRRRGIRRSQTLSRKKRTFAKTLLKDPVHVKTCREKKSLENSLVASIRRPCLFLLPILLRAIPKQICRQHRLLRPRPLLPKPSSLGQPNHDFEKSGSICQGTWRNI